MYNKNYILKRLSKQNFVFSFGPKIIKLAFMFTNQLRLLVLYIPEFIEMKFSLT